MLSNEELNAKLKITRQLGTLGVGLLNHEFEEMYKEIMHYRSLDLGEDSYNANRSKVIHLDMDGM